MAARRIRQDLSSLQQAQPAYCRQATVVDDDIFHWNVGLVGPDDTPFEGGVFTLDIRFPTDFPFKPPKVACKTPIYHLNFSEGGGIDMDMLRNNWSPSLTASKLLQALANLLADPEPELTLRPDIRHEYLNDRARYLSTAREWTLKYAMGA